MSQPLMPMATAVWLVDNTALSFGQIARFCGLHPLEVQGIADGTVGQHIVGLDPVANGQVTMDDIKACQDDPSKNLTLLKDEVPAKPRTKGPRYTPVSKRQDKPDAIAWLLRHHPELADAQICRLVGTTKPTIQAIRDRSHWNAQNIRPVDPVQLGLCRQTELDEAVQKAAARAAKARKDEPASEDERGAPVTHYPSADEMEKEDPPVTITSKEEPTAESVFGPSPAAEETKD